ncbi:MAG TPA: GDSL-type esterase/lipase family protein [Kofleriaceae bacterium]
MASDRSWTITPTLVWFGAFLVALLLWKDGGVRALANRLTAKREDQTAKAAGPTFQARPVEVADTEPEPVKLPPPPPGSHDIGALTDSCMNPIGADAATCKAWAMDGYYKAVGQARAGKLGRALRVSWYGDSVVADDQMASRLRERIQTDLGDGGPGYVYVVPPHRFNENHAINRSFAGSWAPHSISLQQMPDGLYGVGGSTAETDGGRSTIKLAAGKVTNLELYYLAMPKGGTVTVNADGAEAIKVDTSGDRAAKWAAGNVGSASTIDIKTDRRVRLFGIDLENANGAVVDNLGVVSSNVKSFANNTPDHWETELGHRSADLILIMIGANEAEWLGPKDQDTKDYQAHYEKVLAVIRKARPDGACVVVSPTDQAAAVDDGYESRPVMPVLIAAQEKAARAQGCAFYSTYAWMGGKGSAAKWFKHGWVSSDFQHLSKKGAEKIADALYDALDGGAKSHAH